MFYEIKQKIDGSFSNFGKKVCVFGYYALVAGDDNVDLYKYSVNSLWEIVDTLSGGTSFGDGICLGSRYFAIGEPSYDSDTGRVFIYDIENISSPVETIEAPIAGGKFGSVVSMSDSYLIVGAPSTSSNKGAFYLYIKGDGWTAYSEDSSLSPFPIGLDSQDDDDYFGSALCLSGNDFIIGAKGDDNKKGAVYIYRYSNEAISLSQKIVPSDISNNEQFGFSVSSYGEYFVAGANLKGDNDSGSAYVYKKGEYWYSVDNLSGTDESSYDDNKFGECVFIDNNNIFVGSPGARGYGIVDIFNKNKSWGHSYKIAEDTLSTNDLFGQDISSFGRFLVVGSPSNGTNGAVFFYEKISSNIRLAQGFEVGGSYIPSKISVFFNRTGFNDGDYWQIFKNTRNVIDSTNFLNITSGDNILKFSDSEAGFTGNGYIEAYGSDLNTSVDSTSSCVNYPIRAYEDGTFTLWIRYMAKESSLFNIDILLDGFSVRTISEINEDPSSLEWKWISRKIIIPDIEKHILGIKIKENGNCIDKIYIESEDFVPYFEGPDYSDSPYFTVHARLFDSIGSPELPNNELFVYDYQNSIDNIIRSGWYNFNVKILDDSHGFLDKNDFAGNFFIVINCSGCKENNYIVWELSTSGEYLSLPSCFKI